MVYRAKTSLKDLPGYTNFTNNHKVESINRKNLQ